MLLKVVIVLGALVVCQGIPFYTKNFEDVRRAINLFYDESIDAIDDGIDDLIGSLDNIENSTTTDEYSYPERVDEIIDLAYNKINMSEEVANLKGIDVSECTKVAREELPILYDHLNSTVENCALDAGFTYIKLVFEILISSEREAFYIRNGYLNRLYVCFKQKSQHCLNNLLNLVDDDYKLYLKEIQERFDQIIYSESDIQRIIEKCFDKFDDEASELIENILMKMSQCIQSAKQ